MNKLSLVRKAMKASRVKKGKPLSELDRGSPNLIRFLNNLKGKARPNSYAINRWFSKEIRGKFNPYNEAPIKKAGRMRKDLHRRMRKASKR